MWLYREFLSFECGKGECPDYLLFGGYPRHYTPQAVARVQSRALKSSLRGTPTIF